MYMNGRALPLNTEMRGERDLIELLETHLHECFHAEAAELQGISLALNEGLLFALKQLIFLTVVPSWYEAGRKCTGAD